MRMIEQQEMRGQQKKYGVHINDGKYRIYSILIGLFLGILYISFSSFLGLYMTMSLTFGLVWPFFLMYGCGSFLAGFITMQKTGKFRSGSLAGLQVGLIGITITYLYLFYMLDKTFSLIYSLATFIMRNLGDITGIPFDSIFTTNTATIIDIIAPIVFFCIILFLSLICGTLGSLISQRFSRPLSNPKY